MRLTKHTEYALRILLFAGARGGEKYLSTESVSTVYQVSNHHMVKIVHELGKHGILEVRRGRQGGFRLGRDMSEINLGALVRLTEPDFQLAECFTEGEHSCPIHPVCTLVRPLQEARDAFLAALDRYTLADLVARPHLLQIRRAFGQVETSSTAPDAAGTASACAARPARTGRSRR